MTLSAAMTKALTTMRDSASAGLTAGCVSEGYGVSLGTIRALERKGLVVVDVRTLGGLYERSGQTWDAELTHKGWEIARGL